MTAKDYQQAFIELSRFRRSYMGDTEWLNEHIRDAVNEGGRRTHIRLVDGVYYLNGPIVIPYGTMQTIEISGTWRTTNLTTSEK